MFTEAVAVLGVGVLLWAFQATRPPPPKLCGSKNGPPVTSPRIKLSDGRHLAYKVRGIPKETAKYKVIVIHGFDSSKDVHLPLSQELIDELGICIVTYDRAGYGDSDPNPKRSVKSEAFDVEELADQIQLGQKFYVFGVSLGTHPTWACLKFIPHRLAGAALIVPAINYWWPSFPSELCETEFKKKPKKDQWKLRIAHYAPGLVYWWMTQKWFPSCSIMARDPIIFSKRDFEVPKKMPPNPNENSATKSATRPEMHKIRQQGAYESLCKDLMVGFGSWEFDPMELENPFSHNEGAVQLWQGYEDKLVPVELQRYVTKKLPWITYFEVPDGGHLFIHDNGLCESIFKALLLKQEPTVN